VTLPVALVAVERDPRPAGLVIATPAAAAAHAARGRGPVARS
jgi:hypothetical protein